MITQKEFNAECRYQTAIIFAKKMLDEGIINLQRICLMKVSLTKIIMRKLIQSCSKNTDQPCQHYYRVNP